MRRIYMELLIFLIQVVYGLEINAIKVNLRNVVNQMYLCAQICIANIVFLLLFVDNVVK